MGKRLLWYRNTQGCTSVRGKEFMRKATHSRISPFPELGMVPTHGKPWGSPTICDLAKSGGRRMVSDGLLHQGQRVYLM